MTNAKKFCQAEYLVDKEDREIARTLASAWVDKQSRANSDANPKRQKVIG